MIRMVRFYRFRHLKMPFFKNKKQTESLAVQRMLDPKVTETCEDNEPESI